MLSVLAGGKHFRPKMCQLGQQRTPSQLFLDDVGIRAVGRHFHCPHAFDLDWNAFSYAQAKTKLCPLPCCPSRSIYAWFDLMSLQMIKCFLVMLQVLVASSDTQCEDSAYLQRHLKASTDVALALSANQTKGTSCTEDTVNSGRCKCEDDGCGVCYSCAPDSPVEIPTDSSRFTLGSLLCEAIGTSTATGEPARTCSITNGGTFKFKDANDYLTCKGRGTCHNRWDVSNLGAACCSTDSLRSCSRSQITFGDTGTCKHDLCCDGTDACWQSQFQKARRVSCRGQSACSENLQPDGSSGSIEVAENLYCNRESLVSSTVGPPCQLASFIFNAAGDHCVSCLGDLTCARSTLDFSGGGDGSITAECSGTSTCAGSSFDVAYNSDLYLRCKGQNACSPIQNTNTIVTMNNDGGSLAGTLHLICDGEDACKDMVVNRPGNVASCNCQSLNGKVDGQGNVADNCPSNCNSASVSFPSNCAGDTACCAGDSEAEDKHPQCSKCDCTEPTAGETGDPHIDTFDGQHYLLLKQGSFSFWRFSGSDAELSAKKLLKKLPVDFKIYAHYSGHTSYTKGLLLVDSSGGSVRRALELTSEDCIWRTKSDATWTPVEKPQLLLWRDADGDEMTAFRMMESSKGQKLHVELLMKKADGSFKKVSNLYTRCKPGYHINTKIAMSSKEDIALVQGQLGSGRNASGEDQGLSFLQGMHQRTDSEFAILKNWTQLGGSEAAATYLKEVDEEGPAGPVFLKTCSESEREHATAVCKKYLSQPSNAELKSFKNRFDNCVFDVCNGGGEVAAELASEIFFAE
eukprot:s288_g43.t1